MTARQVRLLRSAFIVFFNLLALAILVGLAKFTAWSGPSFAAGALFGYLLMFSYARLKLGYWI